VEPLNLAYWTSFTVNLPFPKMLSGRHLGYCEGELCRIEGAVGAEYIEGTKMRYPLGGAYGRNWMELSEGVLERPKA
jgi:hypothetical protein